MMTTTVSIAAGKKNINEESRQLRKNTPTGLRNKPKIDLKKSAKETSSENSRKKAQAHKGPQSFCVFCASLRLFFTSVVPGDVLRHHRQPAVPALAVLRLR